MLRVAHRILGRDDLAADAVQEALITYHKQETPPANLEAWLLKTVSFRSLAVRRAELRRERNEQAAGWTLAHAVTHNDPECVLCRKEAVRALRLALSKLPAEQEQAFLLREAHGLDYESIADAQGVPIGTVRSRLSRARDALRREIEHRSRLSPRMSSLA